MNLNKAQSEGHAKAIEILQKDVLSESEKWFVFENFQESGQNLNKLTGAFFTPYSLARDLATIEMMFDRTVVDLCAGIGMLAFAVLQSTKYEDYTPQITCVEINPDFVAVGKKLVPEATWICGNILDDRVIAELGHFQQSISNPPFGNVKTTDLRENPVYTGRHFEYKCIEQASKISDYGTFLIPQMSAPFIYSLGDHERSKFGPNNSARWEKFIKATNYKWEQPRGISTYHYNDEWKVKVPQTEIVSFDFAKYFED